MKLVMKFHHENLFFIMKSYGLYFHGENLYDLNNFEKIFLIFYLFVFIFSKK